LKTAVLTLHLQAGMCDSTSLDLVTSVKQHHIAQLSFYQNRPIKII
jgi:hypothetical protein